MKKAADHIPGYTYGSDVVPASAVTLDEFEQQKPILDKKRKTNTFSAWPAKSWPAKPRRSSRIRRSGIIAAISSFRPPLAHSRGRPHSELPCAEQPSL